MRSLFVAPLVLVVTSSCYDDSTYDDLVALTASRETSSTGALDPSASASGVGTSTGDSSGASSTSATDPSSGTDSGGEGEGTIEPQVFLEVSPAVLHVAGPLVFAVEHSSEVERFALFEGESDEPRLEWLAGDPPPPLLVTRGEFTEVRTFTVRGYDADDNFGVSNPAAAAEILARLDGRLKKGEELTPEIRGQLNEDKIGIISHGISSIRRGSGWDLVATALSACAGFGLGYVSHKVADTRANAVVGTVGVAAGLGLDTTLTTRNVLFTGGASFAAGSVLHRLIHAPPKEIEV